MNKGCKKGNSCAFFSLYFDSITIYHCTMFTELNLQYQIKFVLFLN